MRFQRSILSRRRFLQNAAATVALSHSSALRASENGAPSWIDIPQPLAFGSYHLEPGSDLAVRTQQNDKRLQDPIYRPPLVFRQTNWQSWPGDFEGRALLGTTLLARSTGDVPAYLPTMPAAYRPQLNDDGYFGPPLDRAAINEQQLSGHGWYLRALCESYAWTRDPATLAQISRIVHNLALPLRGAYTMYPIDPALRASTTAPANPGAIDGHLGAHHGDWVVSSDTGCAFIFLDGLTQAWVTLRATGDPVALPSRSLIDEAITRFTQTDLLAIKAQTHASLTALRALMRMYEVTGDATLLATVRSRYALYRRTGMTEHYANTNWFGRPESWTEPCAIIDSFMLATQLWQQTGEAPYLEDAHRIWYNGLGRGLRTNGGFGTDTCPGHSPFVRVRSYEAYFCCTMRGGEGHARAAQYLYFTRPAGPSHPAEVNVPFFSESTVTLRLDARPTSLDSSDAASSSLTLRQTTQYPYSGAVRLEFLATSVRAPMRLRLFAPEWTSDHRIVYNGKPASFAREGGFLVLQLAPRAGDVLTLNQALRIAPRSSISSVTAPDSYVFEAGPLVLGFKPPQAESATLRAPDPTPIAIPRTVTLQPSDIPGRYRVGPTGQILSPINDLNTTADPNPKLAHPRQIVFRES